MSDRFWASALSRLDGSAQDGIHLLWAPPLAAGYSVRGFDIQRRASRYKPQIDCLALSGADLDLLHRRLWFANAMAAFSVSRGDCPKLPPAMPDEPYTPEGPGDEPGPFECNRFSRLKEGEGPNPLITQGFRFTRFDASGAASTSSRLILAAGSLRLDCGHRLEIDLPTPTGRVDITLLHSARPAKVAALDGNGAIVDSATMTVAANVAQTLTLRGAGLARVLVDAPQDETYLLSICFQIAAARCVDFRKEEPQTGPNPWIERKATFQVFTRDGQRLENSELRRVGGLTGFECGAFTRVRFSGADTVDATLLVREGKASLIAYDATGRAVDKASLGASRQAQGVRLKGAQLARIAIQASVPGSTLLLSLCLDSTPTVTAAQRLDRARMSGLTRAAHFSSTAIAAAATSKGCLRYRIDLRAVHRYVRVDIGVSGVYAIAFREGKAVATAVQTAATPAQTVTFQIPVDAVLLYVPHPARSLRVCTDRIDADAEERDWRQQPFIARGIQIPAHSVNAATPNAAAELTLATSRLLPGETLTAANFQEVAGLINEVCAQTAVVSPVLRTTRTRSLPQDAFLELRSWAYVLTLLTHPAWRRALGFGYFDRGDGLVAGDVYDYRITGHFRRRDLEETLFGFHTVPSNTPLPMAFHLGIIRVATLLPASVELTPAAATGALRDTGRKGLRLIASQRITLSFPIAIQRLVLELQPTASQSLFYRATTTDFLPALTGTTFQGPVPATARAVIEFPEPVDSVELRGSGFLHAVRFEGNGDPDDIIAASVVVPGVRYEPTAEPQPPAFLGTANLQQPSLPGDPALTTRSPPESMGFRLSWLPPPLTGNAALMPWPADIDSSPPFDVVGFLLERRRVDVPGPFGPVDDDPEQTLFVGNRGSRSDPPPLSYGIDLLAQFPELPRPVPPVSAFMTADDVLISADNPGPPPGSLHQYRMFSLDVLGRRSAARTGSIARLEKRRAPPQPVAPETPPPVGVIVPPGVRARVLVAANPELSPADRALLGASQNAIVLEWGWTQQERDRDPHAREFRIYWQPQPPDLILGELLGTPSLVAGKWNMTASFDRAIAVDAMQGVFVRNGGRPFRVAGHGAGFVVTLILDPSGVDPAIAPSPGRFEFRPKLDGSELRPKAWPERVATVPIGPGAPQPFVIRDRLVLDAAHTRARHWVGVTAADDQSYIADEIPAAQPNGGRPGNESSVASVVVEARYIGRPVFVVPDPLPAVPELVTREPSGETVTVSIDLPALLPAVSVPAGHQLIVEQISVDALLTLVSARADDQIGVTFPDGAATSYALANPGDQAAFLQQIRAGQGALVEGRFAMDFLLRFRPQLERLWARTLAQPTPWVAIDAVLASKAERYIHRVRLVDAAGHASAGAGIAPQIVRVASLRAPRAPELSVVGDDSDVLAVTATVNEMHDLRWVVLFRLSLDATAPADSATLDKAQLLRLPDRRDLHPNDGMRLRLADGTLLAPATALDLLADGVVTLPTRSVSGSLPAAFDRRVAVWAVTLTRDGIPSRFTGPVLALTGATPLVLPALSVLAGASTDDAAWSALSVSADVALERSTDGGVNWSRVSPWLPSTVTTHSANRAGATPRMYRLSLRASRNRSAVGSAVTLT